MAASKLPTYNPPDMLGIRTRPRSWIPLAMLLGALAWTLPLTGQPNGVPFWRGAGFSDLLISHWPNALWIRQALATWNQLPLWNPTILSGAPFVADPLSGLFYPPAWLAVLLPQPLAFNLLFWLHLVWAALGSYKLLRRAGLGVEGALLAGLAYCGMPKLIGHIGLGHFGLVLAVCWTPWLLLWVRLAVAGLGGHPRGYLKHAALAGAGLGLVFLIDPRWSPIAALLALLVGIWSALHSGSLRKPKLARLALSGLLAGGFCFGIAAALALPLFEFLQLSTRSDLTAEARAAYSLPVGQLLGILVPNFGGWPEWQAYAGVVPLLLAAIAIWARYPRAWLWGVLCICGWVLALGDQLPLVPELLSLFPGFASLRVPARWLLVSGFAAAGMAGMGLHCVLIDCVDARAESRISLTHFGLLLFQLALAGISWGTASEGELSRRIPGAMPFVLAAALTGSSWLLLKNRMRLSRGLLAAAWVALLGLDFGVMDFSLLEVRDPQIIHSDAVEALAVQEQPWRAFSPSYSLPQPASVLSGLELADGINPLQLRAYRDYLAASTGFSADQYSVTLPPFPEGDPSLPWSASLDAYTLGLLNVRYVVSAYPLRAAGLAFEQLAGGSYIYTNEWAAPRAWVELEGAQPLAERRAVTDWHWTPNRITLAAEGPGKLVLSEIAYPGWSAAVDGESVSVQPAYSVLRSVELSPGKHQVEFEFRPANAYAGAALSCIACLSLIGLWIKR